MKAYFEKDNLLKFLDLLDSSLNTPLDVYMIGGCAMTLKGYKDITLDVDLVVKNKKDYETLRNAISQLGFSIDKTHHHENVYKNAIIIFKKEDSRIDIFIKSIVGMLDFSNTMMKRAEKYVNYTNLKLYLASNEDVFLLKSMSDREKDLPDLKMLVSAGINFDIILNECVLQHKKDTKWIFWLHESLLRLEKLGVLSMPKKSEFEKILKENEKYKPQDYPNV